VVSFSYSSSPQLFFFFFFFFFFLLLLLLLLLDGGLKYFKEDFKGVAAITTRCPPVIFS